MESSMENTPNGVSTQGTALVKEVRAQLPQETMNELGSKDRREEGSACAKPGLLSTAGRCLCGFKQSFFPGACFQKTIPEKPWL